MQMLHQLYQHCINAASGSYSTPTGVNINTQISPTQLHHYYYHVGLISLAIKLITSSLLLACHRRELGTLNTSPTSLSQNCVAHGLRIILPLLCIVLMCHRKK